MLARAGGRVLVAGAGAARRVGGRAWAAARVPWGVERGLASRAVRMGETSPTNLGVVVVPQQFAYVVERFGKYKKTLEPGIHFLIPLVDRVAYVHDLRERVVNVPNQTAITSDNVTIQCDGVLYVQIHDPFAASYGVSDAVYAAMQLAQTSMRSELGKITLDNTFEERESLNKSIVEAVNEAARAWGITCLRYEIRDITPPAAVKAAMDLQAEAERRKRAEILESEGERESAINSAEGQRRSIILKAQGEAAATIARADAAARSIERLARAVRADGGSDALALRVAEQYMAAFGRIAQKGNTLILPANTGDVASMVAQALSVFDKVRASSAASAAQRATHGTSTPATDDDLLPADVELEQLAASLAPPTLDPSLIDIPSHASAAKPDPSATSFTPKPAFATAAPPPPPPPPPPQTTTNNNTFTQTAGDLPFTPKPI